MKKKRSVLDMAINKPEDFVSFMMNDYLTKNDFKAVEYKDGTQVYKAGNGFLTAPKYLAWNYTNGVIHIEAWMRTAYLPGVYGGEMDLNGGYGFAVKAAYKKELDSLVALLNQDLATDTTRNVVNEDGTVSEVPVTPTYTGAPVVVQTVDTSKKAVPALICGVLSFLGLLIPIAGVVLGAVAIAMGSKAKKSEKKNLATVGWVLGIIGLILSIANWILGIILLLGV